MIKWNKHLWINGGYAHGLAMILEDIECGKYQIVFASAENVLVKPFFFVNKKKRKKHTVSPDMVCRFASNKLWRVKLRVLLFVLQSIVSFGIKKPSNKLTASILKDCRLENIECNKHQLTFVTTEKVSSKPFCSWVKKTTLPFHSSTLHAFFFVGKQCYRFLI